MAKYNSAQQNRASLAFMSDFNLNGMPSRNTTKEIGPINPLAVTSGMYIPPEETQVQHSLEDTLGWGMSDDQNDSDDEMDGNEFDLDFDDVDFLPPPDTQLPPQSFAASYHQQFSTPFTEQQAPTQATSYMCQPSALYQNSTCQAPVSATPQFTQTSYPPPFNPAFQQHYTGPQTINTYNQSNNPPLQYINPSRLQLPTATTAMDFLNEPINSNHTGLDTSTQLGLNVDDLNLDIEFDELYPIIEAEQKNGCLSSISPPPSSDESYEKLHSMPESVAGSPHSVHSVESEPELTTHIPSPRSSPVAEKYNNASTHHRRKTRNNKYTSSEEDDDADYQETTSTSYKRKTRRNTHSSGSSTAHVCDKVYPDGSQCRRSFTRPYDLARHQETLHASVRKTYRCETCGENSKTFSRLDALSRHMRLKHPSD